MKFGAKKLFVRLLACFALAAVLSARAEMAVGFYTIPSLPNLKLWDISGAYSIDTPELSLKFNLSVAPGGKISGSGSGSFFDGTNELESTISYYGIMKTVSTGPRVGLMSKNTGYGQVNDYSVKFFCAAKHFWNFNPTNQTMFGSASGKPIAALPGLRTRSVIVSETNEVLSLPENMTGDWNITMNVTTNGSRYYGSAALTLSNGRNFPLAITGVHTTKSGISRLTLKGGTNAPGVKLQFTAVMTNSVMTIRSFNGKALGQSLRFQAAP